MSHLIGSFECCCCPTKVEIPVKDENEIPPEWKYVYINVKSSRDYHYDDIYQNMTWFTICNKCLPSDKHDNNKVEKNIFKKLYKGLFG